jgi:hypothetical protein
MFDSVYSMILAKNLPNLPEGIDGNNRQVKNIIFKIRTEAGMLVGQQAYLKAKQQLDELLVPLQKQTEIVESLKTEIEDMSLHLLQLEKDANDNYYKFLNLYSKYEKDTGKIEQMWMDEPKQTRKAFQEACKKLYTISVDEYFAFRNHRVVPIFVKKILDAISYLLNFSTEFKDQQMLISDSIANGRAGDEEALRLDYHCKLAYLMVTYEVYKYVKIENLPELRAILADVRFRADSYYIESTGPPGPILVEWIKANYAYIVAATEKYKILAAAEEKKLEAFRFKAVYTKKKDEASELTKKIEETRQNLNRAQLELEDIQHAVLKANDLLQFIAGRFTFAGAEAKQDYYRLLEKKLEEKRDFFNIEVTLRGICDRVIEKFEVDQAKLKLQAYSMGQEYKDPSIPQGNIIEWLRDEVLSQQSAVLEKGRTLGYSLIGERLQTDVSYDYVVQLISLIVDVVIGKMNDTYNDLASSRSWVSNKGRRYATRFLYIFAWKVWEEEGTKKRDEEAMDAWERIFVDEETCTIMAIEARVNTRMSKLARAQGLTWGQNHASQVQQMEYALSAQFEELYGHDLTQILEAAVSIEADTKLDDPSIQNPEYTPRLRAQCLCYIKLHPSEITQQKDKLGLEYSQLFADQFPKETAFECFKILNNIDIGDDEIIYYDHALHWKDFHLEEYESASKAMCTEMAKDFADQFPLNPFYEAAKYIEKSLMSSYVLHNDFINYHNSTNGNQMINEEVMVEFSSINPKMLLNAYCYRILNQGMYEKGLAMYNSELANAFSKGWSDFILQTENCTKGSALVVVYDETGNDRFYGFRLRLLNKLLMAYAYLCRRQDYLINRLYQLNLNDPIFKIKYRIRPSQFDKITGEIETNFVTEKLNVELQLQDIIHKLSVWNTYFGMNYGGADQAAVVPAQDQSFDSTDG